MNESVIRAAHASLTPCKQSKPSLLSPVSMWFPSFATKSSTINDTSSPQISPEDSSEIFLLKGQFDSLMDRCYSLEAEIAGYDEKLHYISLAQQEKRELSAIQEQVDETEKRINVLQKRIDENSVFQKNNDNGTKSSASTALRRWLEEDWFRISQQRIVKAFLTAQIESLKEEIETGQLSLKYHKNFGKLAEKNRDPSSFRMSAKKDETSRPSVVSSKTVMWADDEVLARTKYIPSGEYRYRLWDVPTESGVDVVSISPRDHKLLLLEKKNMEERVKQQQKALYGSLSTFDLKKNLELQSRRILETKAILEEVEWVEQGLREALEQTGRQQSASWQGRGQDTTKGASLRSVLKTLKKEHNTLHRATKHNLQRMKSTRAQLERQRLSIEKQVVRPSTRRCSHLQYDTTGAKTYQRKRLT